MSDSSGACAGVIGLDAVFAHPETDGLGTALCTLALQQAVMYGHNFMAARAEKAVCRFISAAADGEDGLVAVALGELTADDGIDLNVCAAYAPERVVDLLALELKFAGVAHVLRRTAAAAAIYRAHRLGALGGGDKELLATAVADAFANLDYAHAPALTGQGSAHKDSAAIYPAYTQRLGGKTGDIGLKYVVFSQSFHALIVTRARGLCNYYILWYNILLHPEPKRGMLNE